jgi:hypothetical protein
MTFLLTVHFYLNKKMIQKINEMFSHSHNREQQIKLCRRKINQPIKQVKQYNKMLATL